MHADMGKMIRYAGWVQPGTDVVAGKVSHPGHKADAKIDRPRRPCARCNQLFQPTIRRRMLCSDCFACATDLPYDLN